MNFGKWIVVTFILFGLFIGVLVTITFRQDISLVSPDYYPKELAYQDQIDRMKNAGLLEEKPVATLTSDGTLELRYAHLPDVTQGRLDLYRPSDPRLDHSFNFNELPMQTVRFNVPDVARGLYRVNLTWTMGKKEYFLEQRVVVP